MEKQTVTNKIQLACCKIEGNIILETVIFHKTDLYLLYVQPKLLYK